MEQPFDPHPMRIGEILDRSFWLYRRNFRTIMLFSLIIGALAQIIVATVSWLTMEDTLASAGFFESLQQIPFLSNGEPNLNASVSQSVLESLSALERSSAIGFFGFVVNFFITAMVMGGIVLVVSAGFHGHSDTPSGWFAKARSLYGKFLLMMLAYLVYGVLAGLAILLVFFIGALLVGVIAALFAVGGAAAFSVVLVILLILMLFFLGAALFGWLSFIFPTAINEGLPAFKAARRAFSLFFKNFWRVTGVILLMLLLVLIIYITFALLSFFALNALASDAANSIATLLTTILTSVVSALIMPIYYIVPTMLYFDTRIRREGYDLVLQSRRP